MNIPKAASMQAKKQNIETNNSSKVSRQISPEPSVTNPESERLLTTGRRRNRKKAKNDHQEIMNNFIKQNFDSKKDEPYSKFGQKKTSVRNSNMNSNMNSKNSSRIVSRKTSPLRLST